MTLRSRLLFAWAALVIVVGVVGAVVHDDGKKVSTAARAGEQATTTSTGVPTSSTVAGSDSSPTDAASINSGGGASTDASSEAAGDSVPATTAVPAARLHPDPGTYTTDNQGTSSFGSVPPKSTYTIELLANGDTHETGDFDLVLRWTPDAASLVSLKIAMAGKEFDAPAGNPLLFVPFTNPPPQWSWSMTSTDGKTTIRQTASVTGNDSVTVGGAVVPTFVVDSTIELSGDITGTVHLTAWVDPVTRLVAKQHSVINAMYGAVGFNSDITSVLESLTPS